MKKFLISSILLLLISFNFTYSFQIDKKLSDPILEKKAISLFKNIRCLVCQGESIYESQSQLAFDMREVIRKKLELGISPNEIKSELKKHYGNHILNELPLSKKTLLLWLFPIIILTTGIIIIIFNLRYNK